MSIHNIPERYLNTTIHIFRESTVMDNVGDLETSLHLAYASLKANLQPISSKKSETSFEIQGRVHIQDHVAYINRVENAILRLIEIGDILYDQESHISYLILAVREWQAANNVLEDTHHIQLILKAVSGRKEAAETKDYDILSKANIQEPIQPLGISVGENINILDRLA